MMTMLRPGGIMRIINDLFADQFARDIAGNIEQVAGGQENAAVSNALGGSSKDQAGFERDLIRVRAFFSQPEDADLAKLFLELKQREQVVQASLAAGAGLIQPTLMDFLR